MNTPLTEADVISIMQRPGILPTQHAFAGAAGNAVATGKSTTGHYGSKEFDNGSVTGTATINWKNGNVQYVTLTGNTTFTFTQPLSGFRYLLQVAGAFTPTFPATVRWSGGTAPSATASAGFKDIYTFVYSDKEKLFDGIQSANFATT